jgi:galactokinase
MGQSAEHWWNQLRDNGSVFSVMGLENKVIKIDCRTLEYEYHNADFNDYSLILFDSNVKHSLMTSAYNERRQQCEEGMIVKNNFQR